MEQCGQIERTAETQYITYSALHDLKKENRKQRTYAPTRLEKEINENKEHLLNECKTEYNFSIFIEFQLIIN